MSNKLFNKHYCLCYYIFPLVLHEICSYDVIYTDDFFMQITTYDILHILSEPIL